MKAKFLFLGLLILPVFNTPAQVDTLGKCPFFFYGEPIETGIYHDSVYCEVKGFLDYLNTYVEDLTIYEIMTGEISEFALKMHSDDTLHIIGIALGYYICNAPIFFSIYDGTMDTPLVSVQIPPNPFFSQYYYSMPVDSNYLHYLEVPGWLFLPPWTYPQVIGMGSQPGDPRYVWLSFFEDGQTLSIVGDFYVGYYGKNESSGRTMVETLLYIEETHEPPYHFPKRPIKVRKDKVWYDDTITRAFPMVFPILEPKCEAVTEVRTEIDSAGCLVATWDSLPYQEQWVVALNADGLASTVVDTVGRCRWQYCGLPDGAAFQVSVRSRCTNLRSYSWSKWSSPIDVGVEAAVLDRPLRVSPNPTTGVVTLTLPEAARQGCRAEVYGTDGRQLLARQLPTASSTATLDLGALPAGLYLLRLVTPEGIYSCKVSRQ